METAFGRTDGPRQAAPQAAAHRGGRQRGRTGTPEAVDASTGPCAAPAVRRPARWLRGALALALLATVAACSSLRLGYNHADTLLLYQLDRYFDLDDAQQTLARERVDALLAWHRRTQLADYAQLLAQARQRIDAPVTAADVLALQQQIDERLLALGERVAPDLARLAATLTDAQLDRFRQRLARDDARARRELARQDDDEAGEARIERNLARAKTWFGALTAEQEALIRTAAASQPGGDRRWLDERRRRLDALVDVLARIRQEEAGGGDGAALLRAYFAELAAPADPQRRAAALAARQARAALIAELVNLATPAQKAALARKLGGYAEDLGRLAA